MGILAHKMQPSILRHLFRAIQCLSTISLAIFIIYVYFTSDGTQWKQMKLVTEPPQGVCSDNMFATREGCVPCPRGTFSFHGWKECIPWLNCSEISRHVHLKKRLEFSHTKYIWLADWKGYQVVFINCSSTGWRRYYCAQGTTNMEKLQGKFVTRLIGKCRYKLQIVTMYYKHGSANYLDRLLVQPQFSKYNNIHTRLQLSVDYVRILDYLHNSPIGVRVMCDGISPKKLLAQFLITDDFHLILNDIDRIPEVTEKRGCERRLNVSTMQQNAIKNKELDEKTESEPLKFNLTPTYDEKIDIWKLPWIVELLLGGVKGSDFAKIQLRELMGKCHEINPQQRPTANEVLQELRTLLIIINRTTFHPNSPYGRLGAKIGYRMILCIDFVILYCMVGGRNKWFFIFFYPDDFHLIVNDVRWQTSQEVRNVATTDCERGPTGVTESAATYRSERRQYLWGTFCGSGYLG